MAAGNDRNERYPTFPTIASASWRWRSRSRQFLPDLGGLCMGRGGLDEGIWEVRETINFSTGAPITTNNKLTNCAAAIHANTGWETIKCKAGQDGSGPDPSHKWPSMIAVVYPEHFLFSLLNTLAGQPVYLSTQVHSRLSLSVSACCSVPVRCSHLLGINCKGHCKVKHCKTMLSLLVVLFRSNSHPI